MMRCTAPYPRQCEDRGGRPRAARPRKPPLRRLALNPRRPCRAGQASAARAEGSPVFKTVSSC
eukprot:7068666-Pyramimonas_sp.AAC.1